MLSPKAHILPGAAEHPAAAWHQGGITVLALPGEITYTTQHGAYVLGAEGQADRLMEYHIEYGQD